MWVLTQPLTVTVGGPYCDAAPMILYIVVDKGLSNYVPAREARDCGAAVGPVRWPSM